MSNDTLLKETRDWFEGPVGAHLLSGQQAVLDQLLPGFFGYHLMQLSIQNQPLFGASPIQHKFQMGLVPSDPAGFRGAATSLPFEDDSIDVVVLHHLLDFYESPQQILREVSRVTISMGHVVIVGFNPLSLWGMWKPFGKYRQEAPWAGQFIRPGRLMDWLNLLDFKIDRLHYSIYGLPINRRPFVGKAPDYSQGLSRKSNMPFGAVYVIVARKQVSSMTPIRPTWKRERRGFGKLTVVRPTSRGVSRNPPEATE